MERSVVGWAYLKRKDDNRKRAIIRNRHRRAGNRAIQPKEGEVAKLKVKGKGTPSDPQILKTPPGTSEYKMYRDKASAPPSLVCIVGTTKLTYDSRCLDDLHAMLRKRGDWMMIGTADEQKPAAEDTVEAWARSPKNPVGGWYGLKKGFRGRFAMYVPPLMEALGLAEVEHNAKNNRMRAF